MCELHIPEDRIASQVWPQLDILVSCINQQRPLPDDDMQILEENLWSLV